MLARTFITGNSDLPQKIRIIQRRNPQYATENFINYEEILNVPGSGPEVFLIWPGMIQNLN
jgi:hypothetical protein